MLPSRLIIYKKKRKLRYQKCLFAGILPVIFWGSSQVVSTSYALFNDTENQEVTFGASIIFPQEFERLEAETKTALMELRGNGNLEINQDPLNSKTLTEIEARISETKERIEFLNPKIKNLKVIFDEIVRYQKLAQINLQNCKEELSELEKITITANVDSKILSEAISKVELAKKLVIDFNNLSMEVEEENTKNSEYIGEVQSYLVRLNEYYLKVKTQKEELVQKVEIEELTGDIEQKAEEKAVDTGKGDKQNSQMKKENKLDKSVKSDNETTIEEVQQEDKTEEIITESNSLSEVEGQNTNE